MYFIRENSQKLCQKRKWALWMRHLALERLEITLNVQALSTTQASSPFPVWFPHKPINHTIQESGDRKADIRAPEPFKNAENFMYAFKMIPYSFARVYRNCPDKKYHKYGPFYVIMVYIFFFWIKCPRLVELFKNWASPLNYFRFSDHFGSHLVLTIPKRDWTFSC
jgi:hypothetical protein